jgi:hypothetical protein
MSTDSQPWFCTTGRFVRSRSGESTGAHRPSRGSRATFATTTAALHANEQRDYERAQATISASRPVVLLPSASVFLLRAATGPSLLFSTAAHGGRALCDEPERPGRSGLTSASADQQARVDAAADECHCARRRRAHVAYGDDPIAPTLVVCLQRTIAFVPGEPSDPHERVRLTTRWRSASHGSSERSEVTTPDRELFRYPEGRRGFVGLVWLRLTATTASRSRRRSTGRRLVRLIC